MNIKSFFTILISSFILMTISNINAQFAEIPFEIGDRGHVYVKVKINNNASHHTFLFDTGATADVIDSKTAKKLEIKSDYEQDATGASGTNTYDIALNQKIHLPNNISINNSNLVFSDLSNLNAIGEKEIHGIIGYSLLQKYVVKIDFIKNKLLLYHEIDQVDTRTYRPTKFHFGNGIPIPQFDISITLTNKNSYQGKILFDSGAGLTLLVNSPFNQKNDLIGQARKSISNISENLHGSSSSETMSIKSIKINDFVLRNLPIEVSHDKQGVSSYENYLGILGAEIISRFNIILDYKSFTIYLKPNSNLDFNFPLSGITLKKINEDIVISSVAEKSPAYKKGLRKGDKLLSINGNVESLDIYRKLLREEKKEIILKVENTYKEIKFIKIRLEKLI